MKKYNKKFKSYKDITGPINEVGDEIDQILTRKEKEKYFYGVLLLYSFIENLLKWLVFVKTIWIKSKAGQIFSNKAMRKLTNFYKKISFFNAEMIGLSFNLIDEKLWNKIDHTREERNDVIHQLWIYQHKNDFKILRKKLERLARISNELVEIFNKLTEEIGVEEVYKIILTP